MCSHPHLPSQQIHIYLLPETGTAYTLLMSDEYIFSNIIFEI